VSGLQERTGKLSWMRELRETDWGEYIRGLCKQIIHKDEVRIRLETYHAWVKRIDEEVQSFCGYAKQQFNLKHEGEGVRLVWGRKHCDNPNCGTCKGHLLTHFPYPWLASATKSFEFKPIKVGRSVRRGRLKEFLVGECNFTNAQADVLLNLIDLRHLMIRRFNYEVMELKNLGLV